MAVAQPVGSGGGSGKGAPKPTPANLAVRAVLFAIPLAIGAAAAVAQFWDVVVAPGAPVVGVAGLAVAVVVTLLHTVAVIGIRCADDPSAAFEASGPMLVSLILVEVVGWSVAWYAITISPSASRILGGAALGLGAAIVGTLILQADVADHPWMSTAGARGASVAGVAVFVVGAIAVGPCFASTQRVTFAPNGTKEASQDKGDDDEGADGGKDGSDQKKGSNCAVEAGEGIEDEATRRNAERASPGGAAAEYECPEQPEPPHGGSVVQPFAREGAVLISSRQGAGVIQGPMKEAYDEVPGSGLSLAVLQSQITNRIDDCQEGGAQFQASVGPDGTVLLLASRSAANRTDGSPAEAYLTASALLPDYARRAREGLVLVATGPMAWDGSEVSQPFRDVANPEAPVVELSATVGDGLVDRARADASFTVAELHGLCHPDAATPRAFLFD